MNKTPAFEFDYGQAQSPDGIASQLVRQLADPRPADVAVTRELQQYKNLLRRWHDWKVTVEICHALAAHMLEQDSPQ